MEAVLETSQRAPRSKLSTTARQFRLSSEQQPALVVRASTQGSKQTPWFRSNRAFSSRREQVTDEEIHACDVQAVSSSYLGRLVKSKCLLIAENSWSLA